MHKLPLNKQPLSLYETSFNIVKKMGRIIYVDDVGDGHVFRDVVALCAVMSLVML